MIRGTFLLCLLSLTSLKVAFAECSAELDGTSSCSGSDATSLLQAHVNAAAVDTDSEESEEYRLADADAEESKGYIATAVDADSEEFEESRDGLADEDGEESKDDIATAVDTDSEESRDPDAPTWLVAHNYFRCIHNTPAIAWDDDVAAGSANWASKGQMRHSKCYSIPAPRGPSGENLAAGYGSITQAVTGWYDESPERGPRCGGHCTALLWKQSHALGCSRKDTWNGNRPLYVCRYAKSAANFGSKDAGVNMPDYSKEAACYKKYPISKRWTKGVPPPAPQPNPTPAPQPRPTPAPAPGPAPGPPPAPAPGSQSDAQRMNKLNDRLTNIEKMIQKILAELSGR